MSDIEIRELEKCYRNGKWGFAQDFRAAINAPSGISLLTADLPPWMARAWTINMAQFLYQGQPLSVIPNDSGYAPNTQTANDVKLRIDWGVDSARESALVDYPWAGGTFQLHAATIRVYLNPVNGLQTYNPIRVPILNGWMSPGASGRVAVDALAPTYTALFSCSVGTPAHVTIPARAVAYRIVAIDSPTSGDLLTASQVAVAGAPGIPLTIDYNAESTQPSGFGQYPYRSLFVPLINAASGVQVTTSTGAFTGWMQFLLDLG